MTMPYARRAGKPDDGGTGDRRYPAGSGPGLPPSSKKLDTKERRQRNRPVKSGPMPESVKSLIESLALTTAATPAEIAAQAGRDGSVATKELVLNARERLARRAPELVEAVLMAATVAAAEGDHKPAAWALERINVDGARVVDPPQEAGAAAPKQGTTFHLGIAIGGVQQPQISVSNTPRAAIAAEAEALPALEEEDASTVPDDLQP